MDAWLQTTARALTGDEEEVDLADLLLCQAPGRVVLVLIAGALPGQGRPVRQSQASAARWEAVVWAGSDPVQLQCEAALSVGRTLGWTSRSWQPFRVHPSRTWVHRSPCEVVLPTNV